MNRDEIVRLYDEAYAAAYEQEFLLAPLARSDTEAELALLEKLLTPGVKWLRCRLWHRLFLATLSSD